MVGQHRNYALPDPQSDVCHDHGTSLCGLFNIHIAYSGIHYLIEFRNTQGHHNVHYLPKYNSHDE